MTLRRATRLSHTQRTAAAAAAKRRAEQQNPSINWDNAIASLKTMLADHTANDRRNT